MGLLRLTPLKIEDLKGEERFLQSTYWAKQKEAFGWKALGFSWTFKEEQGSFLLLIRTFKFGLALAYIPGGPHFSGHREDYSLFLTSLGQELKGVLPLNVFFVRYDLPDYIVEGETDAFDPDFKGLFKKAPLDIQPPDSVVIPLKTDNDQPKGEDELLASMHKKTRYNIRLAAKKGVQVEVKGISELPQWYNLYKITAQRDKIGIHPYGYYENLFKELEACDESKELKLLLAFDQEGDLLAGIILLLTPQEGVYLYGASSNEKRHLMPAYALQWKAIQMALDKGCQSYDLYGIPPSNDPEHPMHGLYRFKTGFGGEVRHYRGALDAPHSHLLYGLYCLVERARKFYYKTWKKR